MRDDELLRQLAELARQEEDEERQRLDDRWDALAAGTLPAAEAAALRATAAGSPEGRAALEAFAPLGEEFRSRVVETVRPELMPAGPAAAPAQRRPAQPLPVRVRRPRWSLWLGGAAAAALAAALALVVLRPGPAAEPLPGYVPRLAGGTREWRGAAPPPAAQVFAPGNRLELVLTPREAVAGRLAVETFLARGGELKRWQVPFEKSKHGAVRLGGTVGEEVRLPAGESTLVVAFGRPGSLPGAAALAARLQELPRGGSPACRPIIRDAVLCAIAVAFRPEPQEP